MILKKTFAVIAAGAAVISLSAASWPTDKPIYVISKSPAVSITPIATTGDVISGTIVRGIPDGMGAYSNGKGGFTLLSVHEVSTTDKLSVLSASTEKNWGTSITKFNYSPSAKTITSAENLIKEIQYWNYKTGAYAATPIGGEPTGIAAGTFGYGISRFCSATYTAAGAFIYNGVGYAGGLFTTGEETGDSSRAFAFDVDGNGWQLPRLGMTSFENAIPSAKPGVNTVVMANEDGSASDSQVYMYLGKKQSTGSTVDKAGLTNGDLYVLNVPTAASDNVFRTTYAKSTPVAAEFKKIDWNQGVVEYAKSARDAGTEFARVEDGEFDPNNPNVYYFVTTESNKDPVATKENPALPGVSRDGGALWRFTFKDVQNPLLGGNLELLLNGGEDLYLSKPDNMTITKNGVVLLQEDPGNNAALARVVAYRIKDAKMAVVAQFDPQYFTTTGAKFMTQDEESSGIIDVTEFLAKSGDTNTYLAFNAQIHTLGGVTSVDAGAKALQPARPDLAKRSASKKAMLNKGAIEGGQYYVMTITDWNAVFAS